ncbi:MULTISPECIES: sigma-70 family RNA polymerase sigma factor [unclassified Aeromicrobium]|uniref:RNA polymerase sigma factor n=1 Tax=unclassified Aeromicrobium TaxID=2633570 RepID=UPI002889DA7D|nr:MULTISPECIES: sigma-70 family RNA polymerase sigma factor [unclassified Aeromicrobium]
MDVTGAAQERERRFRTLYDAAYDDLLRFVRRRVQTGSADDIVNDVMLVAWRRLDDVPTDTSDARAWLFGVARKTLSNSSRRERKHEALPTRLADATHESLSTDESADVVATRIDVATAWRRLSAAHQEALTLAVLDGLNAPEAGAVLGISPTAFRLRLSRARRSLRRRMALSAGTEPRPERSIQIRSTP